MKAMMIIAAVVALGAAAPALAGAARMDVDGDGKVSLREMQARKLAKTMKLDANHDGRVSKAEYAARMLPRLEAKGMGAARARAKIDRLFAKADINHDGALSADEINRMTARRFARLDPAHSGYIPASNLHRLRDPAAVAVSR
jgi:Ca2+-binding EF-hand superfamily protein